MKIVICINSALNYDVSAAKVRSDVSMFKFPYIAKLREERPNAKLAHASSEALPLWTVSGLILLGHIQQVNMPCIDCTLKPSLITDTFTEFSHALCLDGSFKT